MADYADLADLRRSLLPVVEGVVAEAMAFSVFLVLFNGTGHSNEAPRKQSPQFIQARGARHSLAS